MAENVVQCPECGAIVDLPTNDVETNDWFETYSKMSAGMEGAPSRADIEEMKARYGDVYFLPFNDKLFYLYRPVNSEEYDEIYRSMLKYASDGIDARQQEKILHELLAYKCTIFPKVNPTVKKSLPAGTIPSLSHMIHLVSNFADPAVLGSSVYHM